MHTDRRFAVTSLIAVLVTASPALAWNSKGHMMVAYVAYKKLTPTVRTRVDDLLLRNPYYSQWEMTIPATVSNADKKREPRESLSRAVQRRTPRVLEQHPGHANNCHGRREPREDACGCARCRRVSARRGDVGSGQLRISAERGVQAANWCRRRPIHHYACVSSEREVCGSEADCPRGRAAGKGSERGVEMNLGGAPWWPIPPIR